MKLLFYLLLAIITISSCKDSKAEQQQGGAKENKNHLTDTATNFPGTDIYITLPKGFVWNETAMGFYKEEDGSVIKHDEFKKMRHTANIPVEVAMGSLTNQQPITISGYKGEIKTYQQGSTMMKLYLSFGDNTFREFIEATYFSNKTQTRKNILAAFKTLMYNK